MPGQNGMSQGKTFFNQGTSNRPTYRMLGSGTPEIGGNLPASVSPQHCYDQPSYVILNFNFPDRFLQFSCSSHPSALAPCFLSSFCSSQVIYLLGREERKEDF